VPSSISEDHPLQAGPDGGLNIRLGADVIQALNNGVPVTININPEGGGANIYGDVSTSGVISAGKGIYDFSGVLRGQNKNIDGDASSVFTDIDWVTTNPGIAELGLSFVAPPSGAVNILFGAKLTVVAPGKAMVSAAIFEGYTSAGTQIYAPVKQRAIEATSEEISSGAWFLSAQALVPGATYYACLMHRMSTETVSTGTIWGRFMLIMPRL